MYTYDSVNWHWHTRSYFLVLAGTFKWVSKGIYMFDNDVGILIYPGRRWRNLNDSNVSSQSVNHVLCCSSKSWENKTRAPFARAWGARVVVLCACCGMAILSLVLKQNERWLRKKKVTGVYCRCGYYEHLELRNRGELIVGG